MAWAWGYYRWGSVNLFVLLSRNPRCLVVGGAVRLIASSSTIIHIYYIQ